MSFTHSNRERSDFHQHYTVMPCRFRHSLVCIQRA